MRAAPEHDIMEGQSCSRPKPPGRSRLPDEEVIAMAKKPTQKPTQQPTQKPATNKKPQPKKGK
jgi:hypothetical protein